MMPTPVIPAFTSALRDDIERMAVSEAMHERAMQERFGDGDRFEIRFGDFGPPGLHPCECWGCVLYREDYETAREAYRWIHLRRRQEQTDALMARPWIERFIWWARKSWEERNRS